VVVDQRGRFAVSLVSGHLGGANDLARQVAEITAGQAVISTATDVEDLPAVDVIARERGLAVADPSAIRDVNVALMAGETIRVFDPDNRLGIRGNERLEKHYAFVSSAADLNPGSPRVIVDYRTGPHPEGALILNPPCLAVGVGCRRGISGPEIASAVRETLAENGLAAKSLLSLGSVTVKAGEPGLMEAAGLLGAAIFFFEPGELAEIRVPNPSGRVRDEVGTPSVCEAAAMLLAETDALLVEKTARGGVTVAAALVS
jgi:cobalt-precorrin 5A hydrolase